MCKGLVIISCEYSFAPRRVFSRTCVAKELRLLILIGPPYCMFTKVMQQNVLKPVTESHLNVFTVTGKYRYTIQITNLKLMLHMHITLQLSSPHLQGSCWLFPASFHYFCLRVCSSLPPSTSPLPTLCLSIPYFHIDGQTDRTGVSTIHCKYGDKALGTWNVRAGMV
jgi:hypothetical protein